MDEVTKVDLPVYAEAAICQPTAERVASVHSVLYYKRIELLSIIRIRADKQANQI